MNRTALRWAQALLLAVVAGGALCDEGEVVRGPMAKETYEVLRAAIIKATAGRDDVQKENLAALDRFARVSRPRVSTLPWVHVYLKDREEGRYTAAWKLSETEEAITLLVPDLKEVRIEEDRIARVEPADFKADARRLVDLLDRVGEREKDSWYFFSDQGYPYPTYHRVFLFLYGYGTAEHGMSAETEALVSGIFKEVPRGLPGTYDELIWHVLGRAMRRFHDGGSRKEFLAICKELLATYPGSKTDAQLRSLIEPMEREAAAGPPAFVLKKPEERSQEEEIRCRIYALRDVAGWAEWGLSLIFSFDWRPTSADHLVAIGVPAIPYLIEALEDKTPSRTIAQSGWAYPIFMLRRQDIAMDCLERIVACEFYRGGATGVYFHMDKPERRNSAIANVKGWWGRSEKASQAQMIRNQLALMPKNVTLSQYDRVHALEPLAMLEGPEAAVEEFSRLLGEGERDLTNAICEVLDHIDPQTPVRADFKEFWSDRDARITERILKYGDRRVYQEIAKRLQANRSLHMHVYAPDRSLSEYGQNWAIPILALRLEKSEPTGVTGGNLPVSEADGAMVHFQELTQKDFGYRQGTSWEERLKAIETARKWWAEEGKKELAAKIAEDHPPVVNPGDLFLSDEEIAKRVAAIEGDDVTLRRETVASLDEVYSYKIQRALLNALAKEKEPAQGVAILRALQAHPSLWHLPTLAKVMESDESMEVRLLVASIIKAVVKNKTTSLWHIRLETRDVALDAARRLAASPRTAAVLRRAVAEILMAWGSFVDESLLRRLAGDPAFQDYDPLHSFLQRKDEWLKQMPPLREPRE